jgi:hypothetical protein
MKRDGPKAPTVVHGSSGITYHLNKKANMIVVCLEKQFTSHVLCEENHERRVETKVQVLLASADDALLIKERSCDIHKLENSLTLRKACGLDRIPNQCLMPLPRRSLAVLFPKPWKEVKIIVLPQPGKDPTFPKNLRSISLLSTTGMRLEKVTLKIVQRHIEERGLLNASQFGFLTRHITTLQCVRLTDHVTLNFNNKISTAALLLDIKKAFDKIWHLGFLYNLFKLQFPISLI